MNCEEYILLISGHLDRSNDPEEEALLQAHLKVCPLCRRRLEEMEENDRLLFRVPAPPQDLTRRIMDSLPPRKVSKFPRALRRAVSLGAAAVLCLVIFGGAMQFSRLYSSKESAAEEAPMAEAAPAEQAAETKKHAAFLTDGSAESAPSQEGIAEPQALCLQELSIDQSFLLVKNTDSRSFTALADLTPLSPAELSSEGGSAYEAFMAALAAEYPDFSPGGNISLYSVPRDLLLQLQEQIAGIFDTAFYVSDNSGAACWLIFARD